MIDALSDSCRLDRRERVAAADNSEGVSISDTASDRERPVLKRRTLKHAHRTVPEHGPRGGDLLAKAGDSVRSNVENRLVCRYVSNWDICSHGALQRLSRHDVGGS